ncbi:diguanylate cyclase [Fertoebacter nigrum]|uniref:diguanylate cyclase n=1 Tax=Fertoeibacter niger TaxID=2656921 RepID=A0A8X8H4P8_9RHOB|nr:diguanylate cyclase [Fertoeibacter niger]NUB46307.1 diguanylate cyclase [Fertoeibacter niger]
MVGKILIVDDVATNRIVFKVKLGAAFYQPLLAADGAGGLALAREAQPDLILLDLMLPDMSGIDVLTRLRADPVTRDIPVVIFSATPEPAARLAAFRAGADDFLGKPIDDQTLLARLRSLLRARENPAELGTPATAALALGLAEPAAAFDPPGLIAFISGQVDAALRWRRDMAPLTGSRLALMTREDALAEGSFAPDVFVIDANLSGQGTGLRLLSELRSRMATRHAAICMLRPDACGEGAAMAFDLGADDVVPSGVAPAELALRLATLLRRKRRVDRLRNSVTNGLRLSVIDPLTGLYNRRYALPHLAAMAEQAQVAAKDFAVMVVDIDRFKAVNDRWGHATGDAVLVEVARRLAANLRPHDLLARIGGEEFLVGLADTGLAEACICAERLCHAVQERAVAVAGGSSVPVTVSIGLAVRDPARSLLQEPVAALVDRADRALLVAKAEGRNQVTISRSAA